MFRRTGINYTLTLRFPWERVYKQVLNKADVGVFVMSRSAEREELFKWVGPIGPDDWILLAPRDSTIALQSLADARQYRVGSYKGDVITEYLEKNGIAPVSALRDQENAVKLANGEIDLWATGDPAGRYLAAQEGVKNLKTVLRFNRADLYLAFNKQTNDAVVAQLQQALDTMRSQGELEQYFNKYY
jgi:polar amino acid transport system substrate-binding protein